MSQGDEPGVGTGPAAPAASGGERQEKLCHLKYLDGGMLVRFQEATGCCPGVPGAP